MERGSGRGRGRGRGSRGNIQNIDFLTDFQLPIPMQYNFSERH